MSQVSILGQREQGQDVRTQNIMAVLALSNIVKTSLGPQGLDKMLVDDIGDDLLINGGDADFNDGNGLRRHSGMEFFSRSVELRFPENLEAQMLRASLEFFGVTPRAEGTCQLIFCASTACSSARTTSQTPTCRTPSILAISSACRLATKIK